MHKCYFHSAAGAAPLLLGLGYYMEINWIDPPLADGSIVGCAVGTNEHIRGLLTKIPGVTLLPNSGKPLNAKHSAALVALIPLLPTPATAHMGDVLTYIHTQNPHDRFHPDL